MATLLRGGWVAVWDGGGGLPHGPILDPVRSSVLFGSGQDVGSVFIAGQRVVGDGRVLNANEDELRAAAPGIHRILARAFAHGDPLGRMLEALLGVKDPAGGMGNV